MRDPVNEPLGQAAPARPRRLRKVLFGGAALLALAGGFAALRTVDWRNGGQPFAVARIEPAPATPVAAATAPAAAQAQGDAARGIAGADAIEAGSGVKVVRNGGGGAGGALIIDVPQALSLRLPPAPDPRLVEKTRFGMLPQVGADGARPADVYARPVFASTKLKAGAPRVAILVGGLGLNPASTADAIARLPAATSLGFAPYGDDLEREAATAREAGHELLLQSPMETFGETAGPHTLRAAASEAENLDALRWQMGQLVGYAGVVNHLGGKFAADAHALTPALAEIAARGLFYVDDGSSPRSLAPEIAPSLHLAAATADAVVDADPAPAAIDAALTRLEALARTRGAAIGVATALPSSLDRIARWTAGLETRGVELVPVSALIARAPGPAAEAGR